MPFIVILQPLMVILLIAFTLSQCVIPELTGRPWFPLFGRSWKVNSAIEHVKENRDTAQLQLELRKLQSPEDKNGKSIRPEPSTRTIQRPEDSAN